MVSDAEQQEALIRPSESANTDPILRSRSSYRTHWCDPVWMVAAEDVKTDIVHWTSTRQSPTFPTPLQRTWADAGYPPPSAWLLPSGFYDAPVDSGVDTRPRPHARLGGRQFEACCSHLAAWGLSDSNGRGPSDWRVGDTPATYLSTCRRRVEENWPIRGCCLLCCWNVDRTTGLLGAPVRPRT